MMQKTTDYFLSRCSMIGSDTTITNYPGKNPQGLDLPSDVAEEINPSQLIVCSGEMNQH